MHIGPLPIRTLVILHFNLAQFSKHVRASAQIMKGMEIEGLHV